MTVVCKLEVANPIRSFKGRGATWFLSTLVERPSRLVTASAGNFGQGLAFAARDRGLPVTIFAATAANARKVGRMRALGAEVVLAGHDLDAAKVAARAWASERGALFVEDGREPAIAEGAGTIALELCASEPGLDAVVVPVGNGALIAGMATWLEAAAPRVRVIGVCAAAAPAMAESWQQGRPVSTATVATIADGIAVREPVPEALLDMRGVVDEMLTVEDTAIVEAMALLEHEAGLLVEPAGAAGLAAISATRERWRGQRVATVLCGSNR